MYDENSAYGKDDRMLHSVVITNVKATAEPAYLAEAMMEE